MSRRGLERNEINLGIKLEARPGILRGHRRPEQRGFWCGEHRSRGCVTPGFDSSSPHLLLAVLEQGSGVRGPRWVQPRQLGSGLWSSGSAANGAQT